MLLELLKNSMRATVELHGVDNMPPIRIIIADGEDNEDVSHCQSATCALTDRYTHRRSAIER
jgi:hypothetical protein